MLLVNMSCKRLNANKETNYCYALHLQMETILNG